MIGMNEIRIMKFLLEHELPATSEIAQDLNLTKRQIAYSLNKINDELISNKILPISRHQDGQWKMGKEALSWIISHLQSRATQYAGKDKAQKTFVNEAIDPESRTLLMVIYLICASGKIRLQELQDHLLVSRNTVISDLKQAEKRLADTNLEIRYSPKDGYLIQGNERRTLELLIRMIDSILRDGKYESFLKAIVAENGESMIHLITTVENRLGLRYADNSFSLLYYTLALSELHFSKYKNNHLEKNKDVQGTNEFKILKEIIPRSKILTRNENDAEWYTLLFLSANTIQNRISFRDRELYFAIQEMIQQFQQKTYIQINEPEVLAKRLFTHLRPAVYRMKYNVPISDINLGNVGASDFEEKFFYSVIRESISPIEELMDKKLPEDEIKLISFYFGGELMKRASEADEMKKRAVVVCSNGLIVAKLMFETLQNLFPEIHFLNAASAREFLDFSSDYDMVFTSVPIKTEAMQYVVSPILNEEEQLRLRVRVLNDLLLDDIRSETKGIMEIVSRYSSITDRSGLKNELTAYLATKKQKLAIAYDSEKDAEVNHLTHYLKEKFITLNEDLDVHWEEALESVCRPLVKGKYITRNYVEKLIGQLSDPDSYCYLNNKIAIPHSVSEDGVLAEACGLMVSKEAITFPGDHKIHFIVPFALLDSDRHLRALNQLVLLSKREDYQERLLRADSVSEVYEIISQLQEEEKS